MLLAGAVCLYAFGLKGFACFCFYVARRCWRRRRRRHFCRLECSCPLPFLLSFSLSLLLLLWRLLGCCLQFVLITLHLCVTFDVALSEPRLRTAYSPLQTADSRLPITDCRLSLPVAVVFVIVWFCLVLLLCMFVCVFVGVCVCRELQLQHLPSKN